jgi:hypothetical protein
MMIDTFGDRRLVTRDVQYVQSVNTIHQFQEISREMYVGVDIYPPAMSRNR